MQHRQSPAARVLQVIADVQINGFRPRNRECPICGLKLERDDELAIMDTHVSAHRECAFRTL